MRIAINTRFLLAGRLEGIGRFTYEIARRLVDRRPDDEFIFLFDRPFDASFCFSDRIIPIHVPPPARRDLLWYLWFEWSIPYILKRKKADLFLSMDGYCSLRTDLPTVMVSHDIAHVHYPDQVPNWALRYYNKYVPKYLDRAEQVVTVSDFCRQDIHQHYQVPLEKISVACNAPAPSFQPLSLAKKKATKDKYTDGQDYFFFLGAVHPRKNLVRLLEAFAVFKAKTKSPVKLLIAGRLAWQTEKIKTAYEQSPVKADIQFLGYVSDEELPLLVGSALALTYVSLFEGFGVPIVEAMQARVPVLTSNVSSMPEVAGDAGLLVDPQNISAIAQAMTQLYQDSSLRQRLIDLGSQHIQQFTWDKATEVVDKAIEKAMQQ